MKERIRQLRKELELNQTEFGAKIGIKQTSVAGYETGARIPLDAVIASICREFNVNEEWLRTGKGEMFKELDREQEIAAMTVMLFKEEQSSFKYRLISALSKMDDNGWKALEQLAKEITDKKD